MKKLIAKISRIFQGRPSHLLLTDPTGNRFLVNRSDIKSVSIMDTPENWIDQVGKDKVVVITSFQKYTDDSGKERFMQIMVTESFNYLTLKLS